MSKLPDDVYRRFVENPDTSHVTGFTFVVLGIVHLAGGKISEGMPSNYCYASAYLTQARFDEAG